MIKSSIWLKLIKLYSEWKFEQKTKEQVIKETVKSPRKRKSKYGKYVSVNLMRTLLPSMYYILV